MQAEYPWALGPPDGRYVLRGHGGQPEHVLVIATLGARERRGLTGRRGSSRARRAEPEPGPEPVTTTRATLIGADPFASAEEADAWRAGLDGEREAQRAVVVLNRVLHAQRIAAADPAAREVAREQALVVRVGVGEGEQVAHGRWTDAVVVPPSPSRSAGRKASMLRPQERLAALLGGRDVALACESLALRARADLDGGRGREAALQLRIALEAALVELTPWADRSGMAERLSTLRAARGAVGDAANAALKGGLDEATSAEVSRVVSELEATLRARAVLTLD